MPNASFVGIHTDEHCRRLRSRYRSRFFQIYTKGDGFSACELEYQLLLSKDLCYISEVTHQQLEVAVVEVKRMLTAFIQKLRVAS